VVVYTAHARSETVNASPDVDTTILALAAPARRAVVELLSSKPLRAGELADALSMTPPALSRHLRILRKSGLITDDEVEGDSRVRLYRLRPEALSSLHEWLGELEKFWGDQLQSFKRHAERKTARRKNER
jgi:DNA-binding transcriptional ArsR family regulator